MTIFLLLLWGAARVCEDRHAARRAASSECADPSLKRTLQVQKRCSGAYGAAMMVLEEVD